MEVIAQFIFVVPIRSYQNFWRGLLNALKLGFKARIAELESENRMLSEQLQSVRADSAHKDTRIASLHAAVESAQDMIKERERQMLDMKNKVRFSISISSQSKVN